jgi:hypothetical protein
MSDPVVEKPGFLKIAIDPPLSGFEDVKPRLLEMKAISQEGSGNQIPNFLRHSQFIPVPR